jgi:hypothetical protein
MDKSTINGHFQVRKLLVYQRVIVIPQVMLSAPSLHPRWHPHLHHLLHVLNEGRLLQLILAGVDGRFPIVHHGSSLREVAMVCCRKSIGKCMGKSKS